MFDTLETIFVKIGSLFSWLPDDIYGFVGVVVAFLVVWFVVSIIIKIVGAIL